MLGLMTGGGAYAQQDDVPLPPELGEFVEPQDGVEPEVTIIRRGEQTIEEYRINGQLYAVKIVPAKGPPYYLMDSDGDGYMETRRNDLAPDILVPRWTLFRF